jgi:hypothetical protein
MPSIEVRVVADVAELPFADVLSIYESAGWTAYTREPERIKQDHNRRSGTSSGERTVQCRRRTV